MTNKNWPWYPPRYSDSPYQSWDPPHGDYYSKPSQPKYFGVQYDDEQPVGPNSMAHQIWTLHWYTNSRELLFFWLGRDADDSKGEIMNLFRKPPSNFKIWAVPTIILAAMFLSTLRLTGIIAILFTIVLVYYVQRLYDYTRKL